MTQFISKKNNLNTNYKNLVISTNVNLASINSKLPMNCHARLKLGMIYYFYINLVDIVSKIDKYE